MSEKYKNIPFFFIIGRPRSGTTLLQSLFDAHPEIIIPLESPVALNIYSRYIRKGKLKPINPEKLLTDLYSIRKFGMWPLDEEKLKHDIRNFCGDFYDLMKVIYSSYKSPFEKKETKLFGDKNPIYSRYLKDIIRIFPEAKIIYIVRDYRDHILSVKRVKLLYESTTIAAYRWIRSLKSIKKLLDKNPEKFYTVRYEDFVESPMEKMKDMCRFLGIDFFPQVFDYYKKDCVFSGKMNIDTFKLFHSALLKPINSSAVGKWKTELSEKDIRIADCLCRKGAEKYGYKAEYKKASPLLYFHILPRIIYIRFQELFGVFMGTLPFRTQMKLQGKKPVFTSFYLKYFRPGKYKKIAGE